MITGTKQVEQIKGFLKAIKEFNVEGNLAKLYKDFQDLDLAKIGNYSVKELSLKLNIVIDNFIYVFNSVDIGYLPFQYNFQNEFGAGNLLNDIASISSFLTTNQYQNIPPILDRLIYYQTIHGIFDIPKTKKVTKSDSKKILLELSLLQKHLKEQTTVLKNIMIQANNQIQELEKFKNQKSKELQEISNNLQLTRNQSSEISNLLQKSNINSEKINSLINQHDQKLIELQKKTETETKSFRTHAQTLNSIEEKLLESTKLFEQKNNEFEAALGFVQGKKEYFEERTKYLDELIGREVGASLFETFRQRKNELKGPVNFWKWAVPAMSVATVVWIFIIFKGHTEIKELADWWKMFGINTLKSIPAIFLLIFSIAQYKKERNFQEEYAFKSAVALTIDAFSKRLTSDEHKDELIIKSVLEVYKSPMYFTKDEKDDKPSKQVLESLTNMTETVKEVIKK